MSSYKHLNVFSYNFLDQSFGNQIKCMGSNAICRSDWDVTIDYTSTKSDLA